ncbi:hypothetical protein CGI09_28820, partial [Vibrio parahaemolyticus]
MVPDFPDCVKKTDTQKIAPIPRIFLDVKFLHSMTKLLFFCFEMLNLIVLMHRCLQWNLHLIQALY